MRNDRQNAASAQADASGAPARAGASAGSARDAEVTEADFAGITPPTYAPGQKMVVRYSTSPGFCCKAFNAPAPFGTNHRRLNPGAAFGPVLGYSHTKAWKDGYLYVFVTARIRDRGHDEWVNVWANRNLEGWPRSVHYAYVWGDQRLRQRGPSSAPAKADAAKGKGSTRAESKGRGKGKASAKADAPTARWSGPAAAHGRPATRSPRRAAAPTPPAWSSPAGTGWRPSAPTRVTLPPVYSSVYERESDDAPAAAQAAANTVQTEESRDDRTYAYEA